MSIAQLLKQVLADTYALYLKTQNYHWNVSGPNFTSLHVLFEQQYTELALAVDVIAERILTLGEKAPASFSQYASLTKIPEGNELANAKTMLEDLANSHAIVVETLKKARQAAGDDIATEGLLVERITQHQKAMWMLKASE